MLSLKRQIGQGLTMNVPPSNWPQTIRVTQGPQRRWYVDAEKDVEIVRNELEDGKPVSRLKEESND